MIESYLLNLATLIGIYFILALSLQLALGYTGLINLGHIAFYAIGAYSSALLTLNGVSFILAFLISGLIAMFFGLVLVIPLNRVKGDYFSLATLAFTFVVYALALNWTSLTRGPLGLFGIPKPMIFGINFNTDLSFFILTFTIALVSYLIIRKLVKSPFGMVLQAIRDNELAVRVLGKETFRLKSYAFACSAFFAGIAGSLYAHYITYIDPSSFSIMQLIPILSIVIIGGLASLRGTVIASIVLLLIPEALRFIDLPSSISGPLRQIIFSLILLSILMYKPKGFYGKVELE